MSETDSLILSLYTVAALGGFLYAIAWAWFRRGADEEFAEAAALPFADNDRRIGRRSSLDG
ncbi:MAG: hypothetical protein ACN6N0_15955 [Microvirgula sp.]